MVEVHPLRSKWHVSYLPPITTEIVGTFNGDWEQASRSFLQEGGVISSIEELWSTVNSLPQWTTLPTNGALIFARSGIEPYYSSFPNGTQVRVFANLKSAAKSALDSVLMLVMSESITNVTGGKSIVDVIRVVHKPGKQFPDAICIDLYLNDKSCAAAVVESLKTEVQRNFPTNEIKEFPMPK